MKVSKKKGNRGIHRLRILIVDDNLDLCVSLERMLAEKDYELTTCSDGAKALEIAKKDPFDIAVVDLRLPVVSGYEILQAFKKKQPETEVIMTSAFADDFVADALAREAYAYLHKPFAIEELEKLIRRIAERRSRQQGQRKSAEPSVLVIDNDRGVREIFRKASRTLWYQVKSVEDGDAAMTMARRTKFDVIFYDIPLQSRASLAVIKSLKEIRPQCKIILMVAYGHSAKDLTEKALRCGAHACIYKPFNIKEIEDFILK